MLVKWASGNKAFCDFTGVKQSNLSDYLAGKKKITWKRLESATKHVFGQPPAFQPLLEGYDLSADGLPKLAQLPKSPGIYALFDSAMRVIYYGKATSLYDEIRQTLKRRVAEVRPWKRDKGIRFREITKYLSAYTIIRGDADFRHDIEAFGLRIMVNNTFNKNGAQFKRIS